MRILLAPNAFKESLSALEFNRLFSEVARAERPEIETLSIPLADGGDGTLEVIHHLWQGTIENGGFQGSFEASHSGADRIFGRSQDRSGGTAIHQRSRAACTE
ncbi:MAG: glycerate kinase [Candidatus Omnitrophica bacterium]|nr:glycerate kinase [Candidatus Omnitrophota bacterium]